MLQKSIRLNYNNFVCLIRGKFLLLPSKLEFFKVVDDNLFLYCKVIPNSKKNCVVDISCEYIKIKLNAQAIENKANCALIKFLSKTLDVSKSSLSITSGEKSRLKSIKISNYDKDKLLKVLNDL